MTNATTGGALTKSAGAGAGATEMIPLRKLKDRLTKRAARKNAQEAEEESDEGDEENSEGEGITKPFLFLSADLATMNVSVTVPALYYFIYPQERLNCHSK